MRCHSLTIPIRVNRISGAKIASVTTFISVAALAVAVRPLVPYFEDYFVQAMFYDPDYKVFIGFPNKVRHIRILNAYYNETISGDISWADIGDTVDEMLSEDHGKFITRGIYFYGNDGQENDPVKIQENRAIKTKIAIIIGTGSTRWVPFIIALSLMERVGILLLL
jgi:hypothetical protein